MSYKKLISFLVLSCFLLTVLGGDYIYALRPPSFVEKKETLEQPEQKKAKNWTDKLKAALFQYLPVASKSQPGKLAADFNEKTAIPLAEYIAYRKIFLVEKDQKTDIVDLLDNPVKLKARIAKFSAYWRYRHGSR